MNNDVLLQVENLTFGYEEDPVIKNVTLELKGGEILHIDGKNGVGKTTLLKCIANVLNSGKNIFYNGKEIYKNKDCLKEFSFVMSEDFLYDYMTMEENIVFFQKLFEESSDYRERVDSYVTMFGISEYMNKLVKALSQGTRNKLYIAIMLSKKHHVLLLDEPFTALDKKTQEIILQHVEEYKNDKTKGVIMVTHIQQFMKIATKVYEMGGCDNDNACSN